MKPEHSSPFSHYHRTVPATRIEYPKSQVASSILIFVLGYFYVYLGLPNSPHRNRLKRNLYRTVNRLQRKTVSA